MRTMSDRCLERRITPGLWKVTPGFLLGEKLVEGKEPELTTIKSNGTKGKGTSSKSMTPETPTTSSVSKGGLLPLKKGGKDRSATLLENTSENITSIPDPDYRQKLRQKEALWDLFQSECSFLYDHLMVLKNVSVNITQVYIYRRNPDFGFKSVTML